MAGGDYCLPTTGVATQQAILEKQLKDVECQLADLEDQIMHTGVHYFPGVCRKLAQILGPDPDSIDHEEVLARILAPPDAGTRFDPECPNMFMVGYALKVQAEKRKEIGILWEQRMSIFRRLRDLDTINGAAASGGGQFPQEDEAEDEADDEANDEADDEDEDEADDEDEAEDDDEDDDEDEAEDEDPVTS